MTKRKLISFALPAFILLTITASAQVPQAPPNLAADGRYKVDILVVVGHPDDDTEATTYLAREIEQEHKRVAVVYGTRGNSGGNAVGYEQSKALAEEREMEARHSLASYGITNAWFLPGPDTPSEDVLHSLEAWGHGAALEEVVRLVRLTRPEVILTWLPDYDDGENHGDHQAAGVIATEAFDLAGNPLAFPEQVEAPRDHFNVSNYGEGLRPWQPKKIYYFSDAIHTEFYKGNGPEYPSNGISPSRHIPYSAVGEQAWSFYQTQGDYTPEQLKTVMEAPVRFIFGKSLVGGTPAGDIFEDIRPGAIPYHRARGYEAPARLPVSIELGGPWAFYRQLWQAHDMGHLARLYDPETGIAPGEKLWVPILLHNDTDSVRQITLQASVPAGWSVTPGPQVYTVAAHDTYPVSEWVVAPLSARQGVWQRLEWRAQSQGKSAGSLALRAHVDTEHMPQ
jgi:LmbE family N-acetylglucosaminyl deacetylase